MAPQFQPVANYTTLQFVVEYLKVWVTNRFKEGSTLIGIIGLAITLLNDPQVFNGLTALYSAFNSKQGTVAIVSAAVSLALIVVRQRKGYDEKWKAHTNLISNG